MKTIVKTLTLAALLVAVIPAQAMFNRLGSSFAKRSIYTHMNRKPLFTMGALFGATRASAEESSEGNERRYDCDTDVANFTRYALQATSKNGSFGYDSWMASRAKAFNYCEKIVASREEIYARNINYALYRADSWYSSAKESEKYNLRENARTSFINGHEYTAAAKQLQDDLKQEKDSK